MNELMDEFSLSLSLYIYIYIYIYIYSGTRLLGAGGSNEGGVGFSFFVVNDPKDVYVLL